MDDLIKRSDVWNITAILHSEFITIEQEQILERIDEMVDGLPSADRPQGEWKPFDLKWGREIYACTACGESVEVPTCMGKPLFKFCPLCGARMLAKDTNVPNKKGADDDN